MAVSTPDLRDLLQAGVPMPLAMALAVEFLSYPDADACWRRVAEVMRPVVH